MDSATPIKEPVSVAHCIGEPIPNLFAVYLAEGFTLIKSKKPDKRIVDLAMSCLERAALGRVS